MSSPIPPDDLPLAGLPDHVRAEAVNFGGREWGWPRGSVLAALDALAANGARILGLDLRCDGEGVNEVAATEAPWGTTGDLPSSEAHQAAVKMLPNDTDLPEYRWILVTWE